MTIIERIVRESIQQAETEHNQLKAILDVNPYGEILELERNAIEEAKACNRQNNTVAALEILNQAQKKKDALLLIAKQQQNTTVMIERLVKLDFELRDLYFELSRIEYKNERRPTT